MRATASKIVRKIGMAPPHPGEFIRDEILGELKLSVAAAAKALGVRRATLSDLVNGNAALSPEMALRVEKAFGMNMEMLLRMQVWHDAVAMRRRAGEIDVKPYLDVEIAERAPPAKASQAREPAAKPGLSLDALKPTVPPKKSITAKARSAHAKAAKATVAKRRA